MRKVPVLIFLVAGFSLVSFCFGLQTESTPAASPSQPPSTQPDNATSKAKKAAKAPPNSTPDAASSEEAKPEARRQSPEAEQESAKDHGKDSQEHFDMTEVAPIVTHHQITVGGRVLNYSATTGRLPIKRGDGRTEAEMFFVAYTLDGQAKPGRPLTFAFNGGPGSATVWLHMGAVGPKRVALKPDGFMPPAPYHMEDNPYTLLDQSDLVLVDAIGTGFSRASDAENNKKFWGVKGDIEGFSKFIVLYLTRYERWSSPLFLLGESYGTTRAAGVAGYLADQGVSFNGISLLSIALRYQTLEDNKSNDQPYILLIPSFTMIAGFHHKLADDLASDLGKARQQSELWASTEYAQALAKGDGLGPEERSKVVADMARYTGLSPQVIDEANLRIDVPKFTHYLLLDQKLRVGRLDGRFTGVDPDGLLDTPFYDPTESAVLPPFTSVFQSYVRTELGYKTDMPYQVFVQDESFEKDWNWGSGLDGFPDTATALRQALVKDPYLKVLVMEGYYDLATPYYAANYTMDHLDLGPAYRQNISFATYDAGHMVYLPITGLQKLKTDLAGFIERAVAHP
jgi:carboxypeptidase C (cathepsin A)